MPLYSTEMETYWRLFSYTLWTMIILPHVLLLAKSADAFEVVILKKIDDYISRLKEWVTYSQRRGFFRFAKDVLGK
jgi:hypothetical protein